MAADSVAHAKAELYALLTAGGAPSGVTATYSYETEPGNLQRPISMTVSTAAVDPDFFHMAVRLYVDITTKAKEAQDALDTAIETIEAKVNDGHWGPSQWTVTPHQELEGVLIAEWVVSRGREDSGGRLI